MAFQLKLKESVSDGVRRIVRRELDKALEQLRARGREDEAVHEVRKGLKKVRAALRLVRDDLGEVTYRRENYAFRDAARPLTEVRDAAMLVETFDGLRKEDPDVRDGHAFDQVRESLLQNRRAVTERVLKDNRAFATVAKALERALMRLPGWKIEQDGWPAVGRGLQRVYRTGHRALAAASADPTVENLHEWRKQTKYLWHQLQLVEPAWISSDEQLAEPTHELARVLGEDHDLAVLRRQLTADPLAHGGHPTVKRLLTLIDRRRLALEEKAFALGRRIYRDPPAAFTGRLEAGFQACRQGDDQVSAEAGGSSESTTPSDRRPRVDRLKRHAAVR